MSGEEGSAMVSVLVVDDDRAIRQMLREVLEAEGGYAVYEAEHGGPALERLRTNPEPLVVLLGLVMPGVDGEAVLRAVASDPALAARHRIIMVTGNAGRAATGALAKLREQLGVPLIAKPFLLEQMLEAVAQSAQRLPAS